MGILLCPKGEKCWGVQHPSKHLGAIHGNHHPEPPKTTPQKTRGHHTAATPKFTPNFPHLRPQSSQAHNSVRRKSCPTRRSCVCTLLGTYLSQLPQEPQVRKIGRVSTSFFKLFLTAIAKPVALRGPLHRNVFCFALTCKV